MLSSGPLQMTIKLFDVFVNNGKETDILLKHLNNKFIQTYARAARTHVHKLLWSISDIVIERLGELNAYTQRRNGQMDFLLNQQVDRKYHSIYNILRLLRNAVHVCRATAAAAAGSRRSNYTQLSFCSNNKNYEHT